MITRSSGWRARIRTTAGSRRALANVEKLATCRTPLGLSRAGEGAAVVLARVLHDGDRIDAVRFANVGQERTVLENVTRTVRCDDASRPIFDITPASGQTLSITVAGPETRLEPLLPDAIAPPSSRAVWTGQSLLVATHVAREVALRRYQCVDGELVRTDPL